MGDEKGFKRFSGDGDDTGKALKRWRQWCLAKMATVKDLTPKQRGPWVYTLLDGAAWEAVEHLSLEDLSAEGGEDRLWKILSERFPEKEALDLMGEALGEVFGLAARDQESSKDWTSRVRDTFDKCRRRAAVDFPPEAQGWICLNCAGLSEEQKAIIKAKTQGSLTYEHVSAAIRSCFPLYKASGAKARKPIGALMVSADSPTFEDDEPNVDGGFEDVEAFLADHNQTSQLGEVDEDEAAEALAVTWKERRQQINQHHRARRFDQSTQSRRSFRIEVEELKKRTRCRKCNKLGHWARECPTKATSSSSTA